MTTSAHARRPGHRGAAALALAASLLLGGTIGAAPASADELPPGPAAPAPAPTPLDAYATYQGQTTCDPTVKPGAQYLMQLAMSFYGTGRSSGITRACTVGGTSEHKEGRAIDWAVNVADPAQHAAGDAFVAWLTATGPDGKVGYNARRLGVMYIIWNRLIWNNTSSSAGWRTYTGESPHTDHVHVSLTWNGAYQRSSWWTGVPVPSTPTTRRYVTLVYQDLFGRTPDAAGLAGWTDSLVNMAPRVLVANSITASAEYRLGLISGAYRDFLGRAPDAPGQEGWLVAMNGGLTIQQLEAGFIGSTEYYAQAGGTDAGWVTRLYQDVLSRDPAPAEVDHWVGYLAQGASRSLVASGFVLSTERLSTVVDGYYQHLLGRSIDPTGQAGWVTAIQGGSRTEQIIGGIVASDEYYARAG